LNVLHTALRKIDISLHYVNNQPVCLQEVVGVAK